MSFAIRNALSYSASPLPYLLRVGQPSAAFASSSRVRLEASLSRRAEKSAQDVTASGEAPVASNPTPGGLDELLDNFASPAPAAGKGTFTPSMTPEKVAVPTPVRRGRKAAFKKPPHYEPEPKVARLSAGFTQPIDSTHTLTVNSSRNNVLLTFADRLGPCFPTISGGTDVNFKNSHRSTYEAAHQATLKTFERIREYEAYWANAGKPVNLCVAFRGLTGQGREAVAAALSGPEGDAIRPLVVRIEDRTPIKIGGTRARKARRL